MVVHKTKNVKMKVGLRFSFFWQQKTSKQREGNKQTFANKIELILGNNNNLDVEFFPQINISLY